jgi:ribosomal protein S18 acetylase RimI-like enzyme
MIADFSTLVDEGKVWVHGAAGLNGFIVMYAAEQSLQVDNVAVDPLLHGNGYGAQLLEFAEAEAKRRGITEITLYTNVHMTENLSFYPSLGYREIGRRNEDGFDRVYFSKSLLQQA